MELNFLGYGSAFNSKFGNNSAFIKAESSLFLIDCGSTVFSKLVEQDQDGNSILDNIKEVTIVITHLHDDHVGSLGTLLSYLSYTKNITPILIYPDNVAICNMLYAKGVTRSSYEIREVKVGQGCGVVMEHLHIHLIPYAVQHTNAFPAFGYIINTCDKSLFYSGDLKVLPFEIQKMIDRHKFDEIYLDCSGRTLNPDEYWPHYQYENICIDFPLEYRSNVYLMHIDKEMENLIDIALNDGFNFVFNNNQIIDETNSIMSTAVVRVLNNGESEVDSSSTANIDTNTSTSDEVVPGSAIVQ